MTNFKRADLLINIHSVIPFSRINGSGARLVIFFQGCNGSCSDCFNPETHSFEEKSLLTSSEIFTRHFVNGIEGITISGGEPFEQPSGLLEILKAAKNNHGLSTIVYTGFTYENLTDKMDFKEIFEYIDVLIDGRYEKSNSESSLLARGSTNQNFNFLNNRYSIKDFYIPGKVEYTVSKDGSVVQTGFSEIPWLAGVSGGRPTSDLKQHGGLIKDFMPCRQLVEN